MKALRGAPAAPPPPKGIELFGKLRAVLTPSERPEGPFHDLQTTPPRSPLVVRFYYNC